MKRPETITALITMTRGDPERPRRWKAEANVAIQEPVMLNAHGAGAGASSDVAGKRALETSVSELMTLFGQAERAA